MQPTPFIQMKGMFLIVHAVNIPKLTPAAYLLLHASRTSFPVNKEENFQDCWETLPFVSDTDSLWVTAYSTQFVDLQVNLHYHKTAYAFQNKEIPSN